MTNRFKKALDNNEIMPAVGYDGQPFLLNGKQLYQATEDGFNLSIGRFHAFGDTLRRHDELKLTDGLLETGLIALEGFFRRCRSQAMLDAEQVMDAAGEGLILIERIQQRRTLGLSVEQVYEIASIFYFTDDEDPGAVDWTLNRIKIDAWLKDGERGELYRFFLNSPIGNYVPLAGLSDGSMLSYLKEVNVEEVLDWTRTLLQLRTNGTSSEAMNTIELRRETLYELDGLLHDVLASTSTTGQPGNGLNSEN